jgi:hypothetical protein
MEREKGIFCRRTWSFSVKIERGWIRAQASWRSHRIDHHWEKERHRLWFRSGSLPSLSSSLSRRHFLARRNLLESSKIRKCYSEESFLGRRQLKDQLCCHDDVQAFGSKSWCPRNWYFNRICCNRFWFSPERAYSGEIVRWSRARGLDWAILPSMKVIGK